MADWKMVARTIPRAITPLQPALVQPFHRPGWIYEEKIDGWRIVAYKDGRDVLLVSRKGLNHTARFPEVAKAIGSLPSTMLVLDGEVAVFDERLVSRFDLLSDPDPDVVVTPPVYVAFDLLYTGEQDLRAQPLTARREELERLVEGAENVFAVRRLGTDGHDAWAEVRRRGLEGFVGKDPQSTYMRGGPTRAWLKSKVRHEGQFVVGGVVWRSDGWTLLLGSPDGNELRYRGLVHF